MARQKGQKGIQVSAHFEAHQAKLRKTAAGRMINEYRVFKGILDDPADREEARQMRAEKLAPILTRLRNGKTRHSKKWLGFFEETLEKWGACFQSIIKHTESDNAPADPNPNVQRVADAIAILKFIDMEIDWMAQMKNEASDDNRSKSPLKRPGMAMDAHDKWFSHFIDDAVDKHDKEHTYIGEIIVLAWKQRDTPFFRRLLSRVKLEASSPKPTDGWTIAFTAVNLLGKKFENALSRGVLDHAPLERLVVTEDELQEVVKKDLGRKDYKIKPLRKNLKAWHLEGVVEAR